MASDHHATASAQRLFVGIRLPAEARAALYERSRQLRAHTGDAIRLIPAENYHVTLYFIGDPQPLTTRMVQSALDERVPVVLERVLPLDTVIDHWGAFPSWKRPRVVWAGVQDSGGIAAIAAEVTQALTMLGIEPPRRRFISHVTVGYIRRGYSAAAGSSLVSEHSFGAPVAVGLNSVSLINSTPGPDGSTYEDVKVWRAQS
ncbi:MAG TPA: RNA 2',3'-cyclic phosphodiesterase [Alkalispirochaeta sp.]|nr:RNA 2',3'-cyclic phosphodiesterase [Alkalispirochaeta sp.]